jgi:DNA-binding NarL/FixJ family response regulator
MRVIIADEGELVRTGLRAVLMRHGDLEVVGEAADGRQLVSLAQELKPDLVVLDVALPLLNGIDAAQQIGKADTEIKMVMLSSELNGEMVGDALRAGVCSFLLKSDDSGTLLSAIRAVIHGQTYLPPRVATLVVADFVLARSEKRFQPNVSPVLTGKQRQVLQLLSEGNTNKSVANQLGISVKTVEAHRAQIMEKLHMRTVAELTKYAIRVGLTTVNR